MASESFSHLLSFDTIIHMIISKLSSFNYLIWKNQLLPLRTSQDMLSYVDETMVSPSRFKPKTSSTLGTKYLVWKLAHQQLLYLLLSSLTKEVIVVVVGLLIARDIWLALETTFSHHSKVCELRLKDGLQLMKHDTRLVVEYVHTFKTICDQLYGIGKLVENIDKMH